ncbi:MAG: hypothetical protein ABIJ43_04595 [Candidatus Beckwithbacteria bacterium]|nr:hypothetical protein [Patescibacteria group bacterium]
MCFAIPLKIKEIKKGKLLMEDGRVVKNLTGKVNKGDYLVCQHDMGVDKLTRAEALKMRLAIKGVSDEISKRN